MKAVWHSIRKLIHRKPHGTYIATLAAYLLAAAVTGAAIFVFMRCFEEALRFRLDFKRIGVWCWVTTPLLFALSVEALRRLAPYAAGTGIPQVVFASNHFEPRNERRLHPLLSFTTMAVKVGTLLIAVAAGASTGREGPSVQVAACVFMSLMLAARKILGLKLDLRSVVVGGGAAGLAAAFNTPLAGVTFAIEELMPSGFHGIKDFVIMAIIAGALTAKTLTGEYAYFGRLEEPPSLPLPSLLVVALLAGICGGLFSTLILKGQAFLQKRPLGLGRIPVALVLGVALLTLAKLSPMEIMGPGNLQAQALLQGGEGNWKFSYPLAKMAATLFTYWAGLAGGIFAPCLAVGAALGSSVGSLMGASGSACALVGMAAFLSGTIQAPMTAFVIIFEMTGHHSMLLPVMLGSLIAFMTVRLGGASHLYKSLSLGYSPLLKGSS